MPHFFFLTTLGLAVAFKGGTAKKSILEDVTPVQKDVAPVQKTGSASEGSEATGPKSSAQTEPSDPAITTTESGDTDFPDPATVNSGEKEKTDSAKTSS